MAGPTGAPQPEDLTARARIRHAALALFAARGVDATPLRAVAAEAGVTVGLIVHHYGTKAALREAVDMAVVQRFADAIGSVRLDSVPADQVAATRDRAVAAMLAEDPAIVDYLRRALLDGGTTQDALVSGLARLAADHVHELREAGAASTRPTLSDQVITVLVRQLGQLFLQPLVERIAEEFPDDASGRPRLVVDVHRV